MSDPVKTQNYVKAKLTFLSFLFFPICGLAQKITINGYIKDRLSNEVLIGASVVDVGRRTGTTTNQYGFYSISLPMADTIDLLISFSGYAMQAKRVTGKKSTRIDISLELNTNLQKEVIVEAGRNDRNVQKAQMGVIDVPLKAIKDLPVLFGERDMLKIIQLLPGVQAGQEGTAGFYVRGGNLDQNLVQLDEATIYNPSHLFGLFSTFNTNTINHVQLIRGGFPPQYGGRLSSILDITTKEGNKERYQAEGGIGLLSANLTVEGPLIKNKSSFIVSARRSYIDLLLKPFSSGSTAYRFYDVNAKMNYELGRKDHLFGSFFKGNDHASYTGSNSLNYATDFGNSTATLRWNHLFGPRIFTNTSLIYNDYHLALASSQNSYYQLLYSGIRDWSAKSDLTYNPGSGHTLKAGLSYIYHTVYPASVSDKAPRNGNPLSINKDSISKRYSGEFAVYAGDEWDLSSKFGLSYGIRAPFFQAGRKSYLFAEPRITAKISIDPLTSLKASYTRMNQFVHLVPNSTASLPTDIWLSSNALIKPENSSLWSLGLFKNFNDNKIEVSVEVYYKTMDHQVLFREGTQLLLATNLDSVVTFGHGKSYGTELFVKKNFGRITGWVSYTWSKTTQVFPELNYGREFPSSYDRRHNISIAASYELTKRWTLSADLVVYTGRPYTLPAGRVLVNNDASLYTGYYYDYTNRNNARFSTYNRLDISASYKKRRKIFGRSYDSEWVFGAYNVYSRLNPYYVYLTTDPVTKEPQAKQVSLLPFIPSASYNFKF